VPVSAGSAASSSLSHAAASLGSMCIFQLPAISATERGVCTAFACGWFLSILMTRRYRRAGVPGPAAEKLVVADQASPGALRPDARLHLAGPTQCLGLGAALVGVGARPAALGAAWFCGCHACFEPCQATYQGHVECLVDVVDLMEMHRLGQVRGDVLHVGSVLERVDDVLDACTLGAQHLLLETADRQHPPTQRDLAGGGDVLAHRRARQRADE